MCEETIEILKRADAICFDVDSTIIREEGIDELGKFLGKSNDVLNITALAMEGKLSYEDSLRTRLGIIQPTLGQVRLFIQTQPHTLSHNIKKLINYLQGKRIPVYLISGGFRCIIQPIAAKLDIPMDNVFANRLKFYFSGEYAGYDENEPTSRSGGKATIISALKSEYNYKNLVLIGDGTNDVEAYPPADAFIGYGGNVIRPSVRARSKWYITDFNEILAVLTNQQS